MNFVIALIVCAASIGARADELTYDIKDIRNIMGAWTVDSDENVLVKFRTSYFDENGIIPKNNQHVITHVLFEGNISVQRPQEGCTGIVETWIDDKAIMYTESTFVPRERVCRISGYLKPGDGPRLGFLFTGFAGLDTNIQMPSIDYPSIVCTVLSVSQEDGEISVVVAPVGATDGNYHNVFVIGADDQRIRRVETWFKRPGEESTHFLTSKYSKWESINGKVRPTNIYFSRAESPAGTLYEIIEIRPATESDLGVIPPIRKGPYASIGDDRIGFNGMIGGTRFNIDGFQYKTTVPITGPPLDIEAVLAASSYAGGKAPRIGKPRQYNPEDKPHEISCLGEKVTIDYGVFDRASGRTLTVSLQFVNTTSSDMSITGWNTSCGNVEVSPQEVTVVAGEQIEAEITVRVLSGGDQTAVVQPILVQGEEASTVQLTYRVEATYSTHVLNTLVRLDEDQKGLLKLICISPYPPDSEVTYTASDGIEGTFSGWTEVNPKDKIGDCLGKLWRATMEVTGTVTDDSWILLRSGERGLGLFPVRSGL